MQKSETIGAIATALAKAQSEMGFAKKDAANPYFKSQYADLASCMEACRAPLSKNGLAIIQTNSIAEDNGAVIIETTLAHSSGEWVSGRLRMPLVKQDPQAVGSAITYGRRYALSAIVGLVADDDDGEKAMSRGNDPAKNQGNSKSAPLSQTPQNKPKFNTPQPAQAKKSDTPPYLAKMFHMLQSPEGLSLNKDAAKKFIENVLDRQVASSSELSEFEAEIIMCSVEEQLTKNKKGAA